MQQTLQQPSVSLEILDVSWCFCGFIDRRVIRGPLHFVQTLEFFLLAYMKICNFVWHSVINAAAVCDIFDAFLTIKSLTTGKSFSRSKGDIK
jgi:hypothetical protein